MEQRIEKNIDKFLETIAPMLYLANIIIGIIMILAGIILLVKKQTIRSNVSTAQFALL